MPKRIPIILITSMFMLVFVSFAYSKKDKNEEQFQKAQAAFSDANYKLAIDEFSAFLKKNNKHAIAYYYRALCYMYLDDFNTAINDFSKVIEISPENADAFNSRGLAYSFIGELAKSMDDFNRSIILDSTISETYFNRGNLFLAQKNIDDAIADYDKALKISNSNPAVYVQRGAAHYMKKNYLKSVEDLTNAINKGMTNQKVYYNRGNAYFKLNDFKSAIADYNKLLKLDSTDLEALNNRAMAYSILGDSIQAKKDRDLMDRLVNDKTKAIPLDSIKFKTFSLPGGEVSIEMPVDWNKYINYIDEDSYELVVTPEKLNNPTDYYDVGVKMAYNKNMEKKYKVSDPNDLLSFWRSSNSLNVKEYFSYGKIYEKNIGRTEFKGFETHVQFQYSKQTPAMDLIEYVVAKEDVLFFAYFQAPNMDFRYLEEIYKHGLQTLIVK